MIYQTCLSCDELTFSVVVDVRTLTAVNIEEERRGRLLLSYTFIIKTSCANVEIAVRHRRSVASFCLHFLCSHAIFRISQFLQNPEHTLPVIRIAKSNTQCSQKRNEPEAFGSQEHGALRTFATLTAIRVKRSEPQVIAFIARAVRVHASCTRASPRECFRVHNARRAHPRPTRNSDLTVLPPPPYTEDTTEDMISL